VIVDDFDIMGVPSRQTKQDWESVVDADAVLTSSVAAQRFQPVSGEDRADPGARGPRAAGGASFERRGQLPEAGGQTTR